MTEEFCKDCILRIPSAYHDGCSYSGCMILSNKSINRWIGEIKSCPIKEPLKAVLNDCPHCGGKAVLHHPEGYWYRVSCTKCFCSTSDEEDPKTAIERWNKRWDN